MPDSVIGLSERDPHALGNLACFTIGSLLDSQECCVKIDFLRFRAAITWIESLPPAGRLSLAIDIISYLQVLTQAPQAIPPRKNA